MADFFCADESRRAGEDLIGTAGNFGSFALIECPPPWAANAFAGPQIPESLKAAFAEIGRAKISIRPLLVRGEAEERPPRTRVVIYRSQGGLSSGYTGQEQDLPSLDGVAALARGYVTGKAGGLGPIGASRDLLICTHSTNDKCCGKYGYPFYQEARAVVAELRLANVRVWQCSHLGGHRFAPTMIDFPDGRCYGALDRQALVSILTRSGDVHRLSRMYRGWSCLPNPVQILERELLLHHGWEWFGYAVAGRVVEHDRERRRSRVEIAFRRPDGSSGRYEASVVVDERKSIYLSGNCHENTSLGPPAKLDKFSVQDLRFHP